MILETVAILSAAVGLIAIQPPLTRAFPSLLPKKQNPWVEFWSPEALRERWEGSAHVFPEATYIFKGGDKRVEHPEALQPALTKPKAGSIDAAVASLQQRYLPQIKEVLEDSSVLYGMVKAQQQQAKFELKMQEQAAKLQQDLQQAQVNQLLADGRKVTHIGTVDLVAKKLPKQPPPQPTRVNSVVSRNKWDLQQQLQPGDRLRHTGGGCYEIIPAVPEMLQCDPPTYNFERDSFTFPALNATATEMQMDRLQQAKLSPEKLQSLENALVNLNNYTPRDWQKHKPQSQPETTAQWWERMRRQV